MAQVLEPNQQIKGTKLNKKRTKQKLQPYKTKRGTKTEKLYSYSTAPKIVDLEVCHVETVCTEAFTPAVSIALYFMAY